MSDFSAFFNRLRKNYRHWGKWARRQKISCYRVYDRDIPEFPLAVDIYHDQAHLQEFDTGWQLSDDEHAAWVENVRKNAAEALELPQQNIFYKLRARQRGESQYEKTGAMGEDFVVEEGGHRFVVNLAAYLDTGLFLDHRITRRMVQERAAGKRFLNLLPIPAVYCLRRSWWCRQFGDGGHEQHLPGLVAAQFRTQRHGP